MGVIDKTTATMHCPHCKITESISAVEKGSVYGSAGWSDFGDSEHFDATITSDKRTGPEVAKAKCKKCGGAATVAFSYSL